jgi:hypothetical protein
MIVKNSQNKNQTENVFGKSWQVTDGFFLRSNHVFCAKISNKKNQFSRPATNTSLPQSLIFHKSQVKSDALVGRTSFFFQKDPK